MATSCEELIRWKRLWCWEGLGAGGEGDVRGWDGWMASLTQWTWAWVNSGSWWWTGRPGVLQFKGSQRVGHDWATELNWTNIYRHICKAIYCFTTAFSSLNVSLKTSFYTNTYETCVKLVYELHSILILHVESQIPSWRIFRLRRVQFNIARL